MGIGSKKKIRTGLYGGSFDPLHIGHILISNHLCTYGELDEIWFVVAPRSYSSKKIIKTDAFLRLKMVESVLSSLPEKRLICSDIEFKLNPPVYTVDTILYAKKNYPDRDFYLILGSDQWVHFHRWYKYETIMEEVPILVYPRKEFPISQNLSSRVKIVNAPIIEISSTFIRDSIEKNKNIRQFLPKESYKFIIEHHLYQL